MDHDTTALNACAGRLRTKTVGSRLPRRRQAAHSARQERGALLTEDLLAMMS
jgi:hypothetical protein